MWQWSMLCTQPLSCAVLLCEWIPADRDLWSMEDRPMDAQEASFLAAQERWGSLVHRASQEISSACASAGGTTTLEDLVQVARRLAASAVTPTSPWHCVVKPLTWELICRLLAMVYCLWIEGQVAAMNTTSSSGLRVALTQFLSWPSLQRELLHHTPLSSLDPLSVKVPSLVHATWEELMNSTRARSIAKQVSAFPRACPFQSTLLSCNNAYRHPPLPSPPLYSLFVLLRPISVQVRELHRMSALLKVAISAPSFRPTKRHGPIAWTLPLLFLCVLCLRVPAGDVKYR